MKRLTLIFSLLLLALSPVYAQTACDTFNAAYWASQPVEVQQVIVPMLEKSSHDLVTLDAVKEAAWQLAGKGYVIYAETMVYGQDPCRTMKLRKDYGYTWYPSIKQVPIALAPGLSVPDASVPVYDPLHPPVGSVKISTDLADYPAAVKPVETKPSVIAAKPMFTVSQGAGRFSALPGDNSPDGTMYAGAEGRFVKRVQAGPFGQWVWWELAQ